jgi:tetratricopeptide (TPR) repeat protein
MEEIFKRVLDKLADADLWIALGFLAAGTICCLWIGTRKKEQKILRSQIGVAVVLAFLAGAAILVNHVFFQREWPFSKDLTGILVMRIVGDDALNSLQGELVEKLNAELQKDPAGKQIEVHAGHKMVDENNGLAAAHERARATGQPLNAKLVIWGRKIGDKKFYPRITVVGAPKAWSATSERTHDAQKIDELRLPDELVDEPFYLIHFAAGYSYHAQANYKEALPHFEAALRRQGGSPNEIADLQFFSGFCAYALGAGKKDMAAKLQEAIGLYEKAAEAYKEADQKKWAWTQNDLGLAYADFPIGDRTANLQKAIAAYEAALGVSTEKDFPVDWARTQNNLGNAYADLPLGDRAANVQKAIAAHEAALRVRTEKDFPADWARTQNDLGLAYTALPTGDRAANLQKAIAAYEAALRVRTEKDFPVDWAMIQNNLGNTHFELPTGDRATNLQKAIAAYEAALRVKTEKDFPVDWAKAQNNLAAAYTALPTGDRAANLQKAIAAYEAALRVSTEKDFPVNWAATQNNLGYAYYESPTGDRAANLQKAIAAYQAALRVRTEKDFPVEWARTETDLGLAYADLPTGDRTANLQKAIGAYQAALRVRTEKDFPVDWAWTLNKLGLVYAVIPDGNGVENLKSAKACFESALRVYTEKGFPNDHRDAAANLADVERQLRSLSSK